MALAPILAQMGISNGTSPTNTLTFFFYLECALRVMNLFDIHVAVHFSHSNETSAGASSEFFGGIDAIRCNWNESNWWQRIRKSKMRVTKLQIHTIQTFISLCKYLLPDNLNAKHLRSFIFCLHGAPCTTHITPLCRHTEHAHTLANIFAPHQINKQKSAKWSGSSA